MCFEFFGRFILTRYQCQNTVCCCSFSEGAGGKCSCCSLPAAQFEKLSVPKTLWCGTSKGNTAGLYLSNGLRWDLRRNSKQRKINSCSAYDRLWPGYGHQVHNFFFWISASSSLTAGVLSSTWHAVETKMTWNASRMDNKAWTLTSPAMNCPKPGGKVKVAMTKVTTAGKTSRLCEKT